MSYQPMRGDVVTFAKTSTWNLGRPYRVDRIEPLAVILSVAGINCGDRYTFKMEPAAFLALEPELISREPGKGEPYGKTKAKALYLFQSFRQQDCRELIKRMIDEDPVATADFISQYYEEKIEGRDQVV